MAVPNSKGVRALFFFSAAISSIGPYLLFYVICFWYSYDTIENPTDENGTNYGDVLSYLTWYAYVKVFLSFAGTAINTFLTAEMLHPIYDWWQILAVLEDSTPYERPSEDDVEASDTVLEEIEEEKRAAELSDAFTFNNDAFDF